MSTTHRSARQHVSYVILCLLILSLFSQRHFFQSQIAFLFGPDWTAQTTIRTSPYPVTSPPSPKPSTSRYDPYLTAIIPASTDLRALAYTKIRNCQPGDKTCAMTQLYRYVQQDIGYLSDPVNRDYIQTPSETLRIGAGDCEDQSILLASLLENSGIPTYLVFTPSHAYVLACQVDDSKLRPTIQNVYQTSPRTQITEQTITLNSQEIMVWPLDAKWSHTVSYQFSSGDPIDVLIFPTPEDSEAYRRNATYRSYTGCSQIQVTKLERECRVDPMARLLARNRTDHPVIVSVSLRTPIQPPPVHIPASLQTYLVDGTTCLTLDPSIKGEAYPGQVMDSVRAAPERMAINREGRQHRLL